MRRIMHKELFSIGIFTFHSYGLMIAIGVIAAYLVVMHRAKRLHIDSTYIDGLAIWILVGGVLFSKIIYWLTQIENIIQDPKILLDFTDGYVIYGFIIGVIVAGYFYCKKKQLQFFQYFDLIMPSVALAQGFGRIGCFLAGCCYGQETSGRFGMIFPSSSFAPSGVSLIPIQLIASGLDFLLFVILSFYENRKKTDGQVTALYLIFYSIGRFILEFFRGDLIRGNVGVLSTSQFISIFIFMLGSWILLSKQFSIGKNKASH